MQKTKQRPAQANKLTTVKINKLDPTRPAVALTFDDGPDVNTTRILDTLQQYEGRVSFFVSGNKIEEHKAKIFRALQMECEVICHAWNHTDLTKLSSKAIIKQLFDTIAAIAQISGTVSPIFRPPYGSTDKKVEKVAQKLGLSIVNWSLDPKDWESLDADAVYNHIAQNIQHGDIVLCHDVYESTAEAMSRLIPDLIDRGCQLVTVSELLLHKYGKLEPGRVYSN
jgi:peptidoglycan/xylan/chitin deacetylase (PgdA/CDA1 family)